MIQWLALLRLRLRSLFRRSRVEHDLDDEIQFHFDQLVESHRARGLTPAEAESAARRTMRGIEAHKDACRDMRRLNLADDLVKDVRFALRTLRRSPGFTAAAVLSLGLGIGANTAIFSVVNAVLLKPLPYKNPERIVVVAEGHGSTTSAAAFLEWRAHARAFEAISAGEFWTPNLAGPEKTEQVYALHLSADMFALLGVDALAGRVFRPEEEHLGREHVVVISYRLWNRRFGGDPGVVGQTLTLDRETYTIVGVMPERFRFAPFWATRAELWAPLVLDARKADTGGSLRIFARLAPGVTLPQARADVGAISAALATRGRESGVGVTMTPLHRMVVGDVEASLLVLLAATVLVLLIACANVAHLQLVRAAARQRELALRSALGASRARVIRQLLTESALLSLGGAGLGFFLAYEGVRLLVSLAPPNLPRVNTVSMDASAFAFMLGVTVVAVIVFGLMPAVRASRVDVNVPLKEGSRGSTGGSRRTRLRSILVVSEFAMAMVLLVGAGLIIRSFLGLLAVDSGFDPRNLVAMEVSVMGTTHAEPGRRAAFFQDLAQQVRALPGVESASAINHLPLVGDTWGFGFAVEGRPIGRPEDQPRSVYRVVLPGYFRTMGMPLLEGRDFTDRDTIDAPHVAVISDYMARRHWPGQDPIGQRIAAGSFVNPDWCTIVGIVKDAKERSWAQDASETMYFPYLQSRLYLENPRSFAAYMTLVARGPSNPDPLLSSVETLIRTTDRTVVVAKPTTMERAIAAQFVQPRFYLMLMGLFAGVALVLAAVGIYGVISHSVALRTQEIGVRMALGAADRDILGLVLGHGLRLAAAGSAIGLAGAFGSSRYLRTLLFGVDPLDPATFGLVTLVLAGVAIVACYIPAHRAIKVDPMTAVRCE